MYYATHELVIDGTKAREGMNDVDVDKFWHKRSKGPVDVEEEEKESLGMKVADGALHLEQLATFDWRL